jgi:hypothetical protein
MNLIGVVQFFLAVCLIWILTPTSVLANKGEPGSPEFGYGGQIDIKEAVSLQTTLTTASTLSFDWLSVEFPWQDYYPQSGSQPNWAALDQVMNFAQGQGMTVMLSLTQTPVWAMDSSGPNPEKTAALVETLVRRYPHTLRAIELFPGANTRGGWGAQPNPAAYMAVYARVDSLLPEPTFLVAGGLHVSELSGSGDGLKDTDFLRNLYAADKNGILCVVSLQYDGLYTDPLQTQANQNQPVLRHYEDIRKIMTDTGHTKGMIWITRLNLASERMSPDKRSAWLTRAYQQIRSQLYIGTTFFKVSDAPVKIPDHIKSETQNAPASVGDMSLSFLFSNLISSMMNPN